MAKPGATSTHQHDLYHFDKAIASVGQRVLFPSRFVASGCPVDKAIDKTGRQKLRQGPQQRLPICPGCSQLQRSRGNNILIVIPRLEALQRQGIGKKSHIKGTEPSVLAHASARQPLLSSSVPRLSLEDVNPKQATTLSIAASRNTAYVTLLL